MGIGINFVCDCCSYDTGILMIAQGENHPVQKVIEKFLDMYGNEIDPKVILSRLDLYKTIGLYLSSLSETESTYYYHACVCYGCSRTYEMLDVYKRVEEGVFVGGEAAAGQVSHVVQDLFEVSSSKWASLIGEEIQCLFCDQSTQKITEHALQIGVKCPKCERGSLQVGNEFALWD